MTLQIRSAPSDGSEGERTSNALRRAIAEALPGAVIEVEAGSPGHFSIRVRSDAFAGKGRVQQQQLVYGAIAHLMAGDAAPVHAVDRLVTEQP